MSRAHGLDVHPKYQGVRVDDGLAEGFPLPAFIFQKAADGLLGYISPFAQIRELWQKQYDSIKDIPLKGFYHWYRTEHPDISQANIYLEIWDTGLYDVGAVDFERWGNELTPKATYALRDYFEHIRKVRPQAEPLLYCNTEIYNFLRTYLDAWLDTVKLWFAGGIYYNQELKEPLPDEIQPKLPKGRTQWKFWQFSADLNMAADEFDFGTDERASIDVDVYNGTVEQLMLEYGKGLMDSVKKIGKYYLLRMMPRPI